jgi:hypothetical protein
MNKLSILLFLFFLPFYNNGQSYPDIHVNRPRIWADSSRFSWLSSNITSGECGTTYTDFLYRYNNYWITDPQLYLAGNDSTLWTWDWSDQYATNEAVFTAFLYKISADPLMLKRCYFILNRVTHLTDTVHFSAMEWYAKETLIRGLSDVGGTILDWCYPTLQVSKRRRLVQSVFLIDKEFMNTYILSSSGTSYVSSHNALNCVQTMQNAIVLYNADGLSVGQADTLQNWYHVVYDKWVNGFFPVYGYYRGNNGGWNWGAAYAMWSLTDQFKLFDNMYFGTTKNFYTDLPWILNSINQYWYFILPNLYSLHLGDGIANLYADNVIYRHAAVYYDPRSMWMAQYYGQPQFLTWTYPVFVKLLCKDFTQAPVQKPDPPLNWLSDKVGLAVSRTSWDSTATMTWFFNSMSKKASHEHRDNNTFAVYKNGPLLLDAGYYDSYGSSHFMNYYTRTIAHNSICIFDTLDQYYYGTTPVSNDGGQIYSAPMMNYGDIFAHEFQRGHWIWYGSGNNYQYSIADARLSYDSLKVTRFLRRFLFYKPGKIIVIDHLHMINPNHHQRKANWILHFKNEPTLSGNLVNVRVPGHIETYDGNSYLASNGNGNTAIRTLLPTHSLVSRVGGTGYEYWVNGMNYPPSPLPDTIYSTPGNWRIEVSPSRMSDTLVFLHTIQLGDIAHPAVAGGILKKNDFTLGTDWDDTLFFFNAGGRINTDYHQMDSVAGARTTRIFAADLLINTLFYVLVDSIHYLSSTSDSGGIVQCSLSLPPGIHNIEITNNGITVVNEKNGAKNEFVSIYPNPANNKLNVVSIQGFNKKIALSLIDSQGNILMKTEFRIKMTLDMNGYAPGLYHLNAEHGGMVQTETVIIMH